MTGHDTTDVTAEQHEWVADMVERWTDVYKKSATTLFVLQIVRTHGPLPAAQIGEHLAEQTGWELTERAMYRTLQRLAKHDIVTSNKVDVPRTGAARKDYTLTVMGHAYLTGIQHVAQRRGRGT